jgi:ADP-ribose pyrophosphatase YjhB (NUDIX family)
MNERAAAIIINNGSLLLMHRKKLDREYYVLPGGSVESGETPEEACLRGDKEETGLVVTLEKKLASIDNNGRMEHYFLTSSAQGNLAVGKPESERQSPDNQHSLEWISLEYIEHINLQPAIILQICPTT